MRSLFYIPTPFTNTGNTTLGYTMLTSPLTPTGRGGAGNIGESDPKKEGQNEDIKTIPTIKSAVYTTGTPPSHPPSSILPPFILN